MSVGPDDLRAVVRYALETTRAVAECPFHSDVTVRVGECCLFFARGLDEEATDETSLRG
jgi:hypothetical protein